MKKKTLTILFLVNGFGVGGAEKALLELVKRIDREQFRVLVASVGQGGVLEPEFRSASEACFVFAKKFSFDFSLIPKVADLLKTYRVDILLTTLFYADVIGTFAAQMVGTPVKMSWQTALAIPTGNVEDDRWRHIVTYRTAASQMTHIVAVSHEVRNYFVQNRHIPPKKISTIHYGVDLNRFQKSGKTIRTELGLSDHDLIISVVGHLSDVKGHTYLLKASPPLI
ncbi:MAG: glycosyltransferase, partial [Calditrichaeota bacterium]|nr:glycosyltransferase [Calditrichota bacterium]